ncbi:MAG: hypothetical protein JKY66_04215 [Spongiibacteraceae bacterium]|nr:hypothetical protein [Spongiibacteraceae bacterium]MBN4055272.1 hypothetical protein [bacterium AH-315-K03]
MISKKIIRIFFSSVLIVLGVQHLAVAAPSMDVCISAVSSVQAYLDAKQHTALKRKEAGGLSETNYQYRLQKFSEQAQRFTLDACMASEAEQTELFQCLADNTGNIEHCNQ